MWGPGRLSGRYDAHGRSSAYLISSVFRTEEPWPDRLVRGPLSLPLLRILRTPYSRLQTPSLCSDSVRPRHRPLPAIARLEKAGSFPLSWYLGIFVTRRRSGGHDHDESINLSFCFSPLLFPLLRLWNDSQRIGFPHLLNFVQPGRMDG